MKHEYEDALARLTARVDKLAPFKARFEAKEKDRENCIAEAIRKPPPRLHVRTPGFLRHVLLVQRLIGIIMLNSLLFRVCSVQASTISRRRTTYGDIRPRMLNVWAFVRTPTVDSVSLLAVSRVWHFPGRGRVQAAR